MYIYLRLSFSVHFVVHDCFNTIFSSHMSKLCIIQWLFTLKIRFSFARLLLSHSLFKAAPFYTINKKSQTENVKSVMQWTKETVLPFFLFLSTFILFLSFTMKYPNFQLYSKFFSEYFKNQAILCKAILSRRLTIAEMNISEDLCDYSWMFIKFM